MALEHPEDAEPRAGPLDRPNGHARYHAEQALLEGCLEALAEGCLEALAEEEEEDLGAPAADHPLPLLPLPLLRGLASPQLQLPA